MRVTLDARDVRGAEAIDGEGAGNLEWFSGCHVCIDLGIRQISEADARRGDPADGARRGSAPVIDEPVTRMEHAGAAALGTPSLAGDLRQMRLAVQLAVELESGVTAENEAVDGRAVDQCTHDSFGRGPGQQAHELGSIEGASGSSDSLLVYAGGEQNGLDTRGAQGGESRRRGRGEVEAHGAPKLGVCEMTQMGDLIGTSVELDVTNIAHGGVSVARHEGRVVFVSDAIPGERVLARITEDSKKSFWRADTVRVLEPSAYRQAHIWGAASIDRDPVDRAGGAEFGHIQLAHQRSLKAQVLADGLQRMAHLSLDTEVEAVAGDDERSGTGWRTRVSLHVDSSGRPGPFAARSHRVIPVTDLPLATDALAAAAPLDQVFAGEDRVEVLAPSTGGVRLIIGDQKPSVITERVGDREFRLADRGFWQVHRGAAEVLTSAVQDAIDGTLFDPHAANLDLYGGVGLLAAAVADRFGQATRITTVESDPSATDHAASNLAEWIGARAETGRVERWLAQLAASAGSQERARLASATVVLDPPRSGAGRQVIESIAALAPAQIVYVACDPIAFARDVEILAGRGYSLTLLRAFDLFPNTHHLEAIGRFVRA